MLWWSVNRCIQTAISKTTTNMTQFASTLALQYCSYGQFNCDTRMKWAESLNTTTTEILTRRRIVTQGVWRVSVNRSSLWNLKRNDHFPTKKTLNRFYAWTRRDPINKDTTTLSHKTLQFGITKSGTSPDFWYTGVLSLNLGTLHFLSLNLIHVQYCDIMRFMVLHNRHHKVSRSSCTTTLLLFCQGLG